MAYGIALRTTAGLVDLGAQAVRSARLVRTINLSGNSGSRSVPEFSSATGFFHARLTNQSLLPPCRWDEGAKTFYWSTAGFIEHVTAPQFTVYFFRNR